MNEFLWLQVFWSVCVVVAVAAPVLASRSRLARYAGRAAVGLLMLLGGALFNAVNLATGGDYARLFGWFVTVYVLVIVPPLVLLLRAERRAVAVATTPAVVSNGPNDHAARDLGT
ncbi:hypothetical protein MLP_30720 [Microlunatus phosphovorus NM-1]|uniref:Uncharacterized protein n=1 Tax=Microlunatus phosphovorus (strain ATCC 700054 / DSM 10555 / JCM 9379 / NBRC 101784 / NCIMB 13414 / VKM Ac-1990 / NM-1) TaxID=1032480 RepID=F5XKL4_MICPN|nr:hypothetical protein [Microlunatus phosphovorus]BAK36086.1 hypothetical protein MLP_30720 [Microlunatus phosphovorus NM-1]